MPDPWVADQLRDIPIERPRPEFVTGLVDRLARELAAASSPRPPAPPPARGGAGHRFLIGALAAACVAGVLGVVAVRGTTTGPSASDFVAYANGMCRSSLVQAWDTSGGGPDEQVVATAVALVDGMQAHEASLLVNLDRTTATRTIEQLEQTRLGLVSEPDPSMAVRQTFARLRQLGATACDVQDPVRRERSTFALPH